MDAVKEVKSRLNIEDVVSEYVQLKRAGRNFKGLSPFTNERTPSFIVSPEKQIWHDFSSGKGGDLFSFIEEVEGLDFKGSLELLARKAGVDLEAFQKNSSRTNSSYKNRLFEAVEAAVSFYQVNLTKNEKALKYLRIKRGYEKQTIIDFRFGYSKNAKNSLAQYLLGKSFVEKELLDSGLCVKRGGDLVDMFRDRIMVPLSDSQGRAVGFTARQLSESKDSPKYINTPATVLYDKSRQLFGMHLAKEGIRKTGYVVVVEGNLDVVASHQAGISNVVASAGTALTTYHLKTLQRFTGDVRLAFDEDRAGQEAAERTIPLAQELGLELSLISIPSGKDPDELIKQDVKLWEKAINEPTYMVDWLISKIEESVDLKSAQGKRQFTSVVLDTIKQIKDSVEQEHYIRIVADKTNSSVDSIMKKFDSSSHKTTRLKRVKPQEVSAELNEHRVREQHLLGVLCSVPVFKPLLTSLPREMFSERARDFLIKFEESQQIEESDDYGKMVLLLFEETYQHTERSELIYQTRQLLNRLIDFYVNSKKREIIEKLEQAEGEEETKLLNQVQNLQNLSKETLSEFDNLIKEEQ